MGSRRSTSAIRSPPCPADDSGAGTREAFVGGATAVNHLTVSADENGAP
jgi:hypothetical protein